MFLKNLNQYIPLTWSEISCYSGISFMKSFSMTVPKYLAMMAWSWARCSTYWGSITYYSRLHQFNFSEKTLEKTRENYNMLISKCTLSLQLSKRVCARQFIIAIWRSRYAPARGSRTRALRTLRTGIVRTGSPLARLPRNSAWSPVGRGDLWHIQGPNVY